MSHAAPGHHFGDKAGLLTAVATEGLELFADALTEAGDNFLEVGTAYVRFATQHRAHFEVMFRPELLRQDDPELIAAQQRASGVLVKGARTISKKRSRQRDAALAAWSIVHGFSSLWLSGALPHEPGEKPEDVARPVLRLLLER